MDNALDWLVKILVSGFAKSIGFARRHPAIAALLVVIFLAWQWYSFVLATGNLSNSGDRKKYALLWTAIVLMTLGPFSAPFAVIFAAACLYQAFK